MIFSLSKCARIILAGAVVVFAAAIIAACSRGPALQEQTFTGLTQGTTYTVRIVSEKIAENDTRAAINAINDSLELVDSLMSNFRPDSQLSQFNDFDSTEHFPVAPEMVEIVELAQRMSRMSGGAFDITVAPLVRAWGFGPDGLPEPPPADELERLRQLVGYEAIEVLGERGAIRKSRPDVTIDLNGIAQGYSVDVVALALDAIGFENYMVEIGGELRTRGQNARGIAWQIGVERPVPDERRLQLVLPVSDMSVSTSGDYRKYREIDGLRVSHTIDPRTGRPIQHELASVTIVDPSCAVADAFCTAIMVLGPEEGYRLALDNDLAAFLMIHTGNGRFAEKMTPQFEALQ